MSAAAELAMLAALPDLLQPPLPLQLAWLGLLALATLDWLRRGCRDLQKQERTLAWLLLTALAAVLLVRVVTAVPLFLHANLHGPALLGDVLGFPKPAEERAEYGCGHATLLGLVAAALGRRWEVVVGANQLTAVATLGLVAWQAQRWLPQVGSAQPRLALWVVAVGALAPPLVLLGASEDAHNTAALFAWLATLALGRYARRRQLADLALAVLAAGWMLWSRQTMMMWLPVAVALPWWQHPDLRRDRRWLVALGALLVLLALRMAASLQHPGDRLVYAIVARLLADPSDLLPMLGHHPLFSPELALLTAPLLVFGWVQLPRSPPLGRPLAWALLGLLVLTAPFGVPAEGSNVGFRAPVLWLALLPQALAAQWLAAHLTQWLRPLAGLALAVSPLLWPSWSDLHRAGPLEAEYLLLRTALPQLPPGALLAVPDLREPQPSWHVPRHLLPKGVQLIALDEHAPRDQPVYWVLGVGCRARSPLELLGTDNLNARVKVVFDSFRHLAPAAPATLRPECAQWLPQSHPVGPLVQVEAPDELPFALYGGAPVQLALMLRPAAPPIDPAGARR